MAHTAHASSPTGSRRSSDVLREPDGRDPWSLLSAWSPVAVALAMVAYGAAAGQGVPDALRVTVVLVLSQVLPGVVLWRAVRPRHGWWLEDVAMGFAVGSVLAIGVQVVAGLSGIGLVAWATLLPAIVVLAVPASRHRVLTARTTALPVWFGPLVAGTALLFVGQLRSYFRQVPMEWPSGARTPHVDAYLHLALSAQLAERGPTTFPWVQSEALGYHWFSHAWIAQLGVASGAELDGIIFRFMAALMPIAVAAAVAAAALRLTGRAWTGPVAAVVACFGGDLNVFGRINAGFPIAPLSPSLALGAPMLLAIVVLLATRWRREAGPGAIVLVAILSVGAAGTKGSTLPLIVAGLALTIVAMLLFDRRMLPRVVADFVVVLVCLVIAVVFVFRGSGAGLHLAPDQAVDQSPYGVWLGGVDGLPAIAFLIVAAVVGVVSRGMLGLLLPFTPETRRDPLSWLLIGAAGAGAGAVGLFGHPGASQGYFARSADPLIALATVLGLVVLVDWLRRRELVRVAVVGLVAGVAIATAPVVLFGPISTGTVGRAFGMAVVAVVLLLVAAVAAGAGGRFRVERARMAAGAALLAVVVGGLAMNRTTLVQDPLPELADVGLDRPLATSVDQVEAARWIRDNSDVDDLVMTNRHCVTPEEPFDGCDSRRWLVAGFSERQMLVEGWTAVPRSAEIAPEGRDSITVAYWDQDLLRLNDGFIAEPTQAAADELRERGVRWVYADRTRPRAETLEPFAELRYSNDDVDVYELPAA